MPDVILSSPATRARLTAELFKDGGALAAEIRFVDSIYEASPQNLLQFIIYFTRFGRAMRAVSFDHNLASLMGIPTNQIISFTFVLGSALAGAAGVLVGLIYPRIEPLMGVMPGLKAFVSAVLGGIGSIVGAVVGAITLGLAEEFLVGYWKPSYRDALAFAVLVLILLFKPTGLFGKKTSEKV